MLKKIPAKLIAAVALIGLIIVIDLIVKKPSFDSAKDRLFELLHHSNKIGVKGDTVHINGSEFLNKYYSDFGYKENWTDSTHETDKYRDMLIQMLQYADSLGLDRKDYHEDYIRRFDSLSHLPNFDYSKWESENELIFTDAALSFLYNVAYGKEIKIDYNGVNYNIDSEHIISCFNDLLAHQDWRKTLDSIEPKTSQYRSLKTELNRMQGFLFNNADVDTGVISKEGDSRALVVLKLKAYGLIADTLNVDSVNNSALKVGIGSFQKMMSIDTTGKPDDKTIGFLNFPLARRVEQIKESLNYWRWTGRLKEREFILVNIPAARLQIVRSDSTQDLDMRVILGKSSTQTPSFTAYITKVITYPYWVVPFSIATKEMLPKIRRGISYLDDNNLQVINAKGEDVDPHTLDWTRFSTHFFPYTIRQSTGCDNSLGVLMFYLNSPFSIYLHDTNRRDLFGKKNRFLSHGCIRVEKPLALAEFLLSNGLDSASVEELNQCVTDQKPKEFPLKKKFPVLILYMTADVDEYGNLKFYNDVYGEEKTNMID